MDYEAHAAAALVIMAEQKLRDQEKQQDMEKSRHKNLVRKYYQSLECHLLV